MRKLGKFIGRLILVLAVAGAAFWIFAPREPVAVNTAFDTAALGDDVDAYLAAAEAGKAGITEGTAKQVVWAGVKGVKTPLAIVYLHGFSATSEEIRPVPDKVARALGANLFFTRLTGHGRGGPAMAEATASAWIRDLAEAMAVGRAIGEKVVILSTSTGGTLAALAAADPNLSENLAGIVFVSPNFATRDKAAEAILSLPMARTIAPMLAGAEYSWEPRNEAHGKYWTTRYPVEALVPMQALVNHVAALDYASITTPALFIYLEDDQVVDASRTTEVVAMWGGPKQVLRPELTEADDPGHHVIMGAITSPNQVDWGANAIIEWVRGL